MERFVDEAEIFIKAGKGGHGCVSFRRAKFIPRGGPNGGDGGNGGNVVFRADPQVETLLDFKFRPLYHAENGQPGMGRDMFGHRGEDLLIRVPIGTIIRDRDTDMILKDMDQPGMEVVLARGGRGGYGNMHYKSSTNQAPRYAEKGDEGEERHLRLELKLVADVGLVGLPNAGKSTFLSRVSSAHPKIASYPFTTLRPYLGIVSLDMDTRYVVADLPGLIEGAHGGVGLGDQFLRHVERTRVLLFILDASGMSGTPPLKAYEILRHELSAFGPSLLEKRCIVAANKMDIPEASTGFEALCNGLDVPVFPISGVTGQGVRELLSEIARVLSEVKGKS